MTSTASPVEQDSIEDVAPGTILKLDAEDMGHCVNTIREYDPAMAEVLSVVRSVDSMYLVDVTLADGALWQLYWHPARLMCILRKLGSNHIGKPLTPDLACAYHPEDYDRQAGRAGCPGTIPAVECGEGFRQLEFDEKILPTDEWYGGPRQGWERWSGADGSYWPHHGNTMHRPYSLVRRRII